MQDKCETPRDFSRRTDALAVRMGLNIQDLPDVLGIGRASLFSYRAGKRSISNKVWLKLRAAEISAGIGVEEESAGGSPVVREDTAPYHIKPLREPGEPTIPDRLAQMEEHHQRTLAEMRQIKESLAALMDMFQSKPKENHDEDNRTDNDGTDANGV